MFRTFAQAVWDSESEANIYSFCIQGYITSYCRPWYHLFPLEAGESQRIYSPNLSLRLWESCNNNGGYYHLYITLKIVSVSAGAASCAVELPACGKVPSTWWYYAFYDRKLRSRDAINSCFPNFTLLLKNALHTMGTQFSGWACKSQSLTQMSPVQIYCNLRKSNT